MRRRKKFHSLLHVGELIGRHVEIELSPLGVRPKQARILAALGRMGSVSQAGLAREYDVTEASMSTMTARLIAAGWIARSVDPDSRNANMLSLTPEGEVLIDKIHEAWARIDALIEDRIGKAEAEALSDLTVSLRDALGGRVAGRRRGAQKTANARREEEDSK